ncbi:MAG: carbohydrate ABC transporter permease [Treponemataceae bacterium]
MAVSGFKQQFEIFTKGVFALPQKIIFENYIAVLNGGIATFFINSVIVTLVSMVIIVIASSFASYIFSRLKFKMNKALFSLVVIAMTIPVHVTLIPVYLLTQKIGLYNSVWALIGPYVAFNLPISIFILTNFMKEIPRELEESAEIDGCNRWVAFFKVIFPLSMPGLSTIAIYAITVMWNEFIFALVLTQSRESRTLPLSIWEFQGQYSSNVPMVMSVLTISALPMILAFVIAQEKVIKGMMAGAVKG